MHNDPYFDAIQAVDVLETERHRQEQRVRYWQDKAVEQAAKLVTEQSSNTALRQRVANYKDRAEKQEARAVAAEESLWRKERQIAGMASAIEKLEAECQAYYARFTPSTFKVNLRRDPHVCMDHLTVEFDMPHMRFYWASPPSDTMSLAERITREMSRKFTAEIDKQVRRSLGLVR